MRLKSSFLKAIGPVGARNRHAWPRGEGDWLFHRRTVRHLRKVSMQISRRRFSCPRPYGTKEIEGNRLEIAWKLQEIAFDRSTSTQYRLKSSPKRPETALAHWPRWRRRPPGRGPARFAGLLAVRNEHSVYALQPRRARRSQSVGSLGRWPSDATWKASENSIMRLFSIIETELVTRSQNTWSSSIYTRSVL